jgi:hypothetical protein
MAKQTIKVKNADLSSNLVLPKYIAHLLGYDNINILFDDLKNTDEGYHNNISFYCETLLSKENRIIMDQELEDYDNNIKDYTNKIKRSNNFKLKYYQYLAILFNEIFLDKYFNGNTQKKIYFINEINDYIKNNNVSNNKLYSYTKDFKSPKIAYWMATGSGKTIIMHINYLQFIYYNKKYNNKIKIDNYILITPSEYLTAQHLKEFEKSGIRAISFNGNSIDNFSEEGAVKVIDINKLKLNEDKKGSGVSIDISSFGSNNLILVDEGHKGYKSDERKWLDIRNRLSESGFTYEYSATFGQALSSDQELIDIYSKTIVFDYSYKYFYDDGYGKEFFVINLDPNKFNEATQRNILLLANAISYAEQLYIYKKYPEDMKHYNIEQPLWMFVGSKVNVTDKRTQSDIYNVISFIQWLINNDKNKLIKLIENIITGQSGILDENGNDVFGKLYDENLFKFFRGKIINKELNFDDIYNIIFNDILKNKNNSYTIYLSKIKNADGEIGIKIGNENNYFGLIDIGDRENFLKNMNLNNVKIIDDNFNKSLFENINKTNDINMIIGAKKFIEGWDTYRASTFSLLYIGQSEGSQIIQLFGRGVRLKGVNNSLKRSNIEDPKINSVQTIYIYGINADYLRIFRDIINNENSLYIVRNIKTRKDVYKNAQDLPIIKANIDYNKFYSKPIFVQDINVRLNIDLIPRAVRIESQKSTLNDTINIEPYKLEKDILDAIDWDNIYLKLLEFKDEMDYYNIIIDIKKIKEFIYSKKYDLYIPVNMIDKNNFNYFKYVNDIIFEISKNYIIKSYNNQFNNDLELKIENLKDNEILDNYKVYIKDNVAKNFNLINKDYLDYINFNILKNIPGIKIINVDRSLYKPLFSISKNNSVKIIPEGLNDGEQNLINDLCNYLDDSDLNQKYSFYLLRNGIKGKGIGLFVNDSWIYPDFILWLINENECKVIFLEPHGLGHANLDEDPKINLYNYFKNLTLKNLIKVNQNYKQLSLDSFVISVTSYDYLKNLNSNIKNMNLNDLAKEKHILFQKKDNDNYNYDYIKEMFNLI